MLRAISLVMMLLVGGKGGDPATVRHFPTIMYGQILLGPGASRYETIFTVTSKKKVEVTLDLFTEKGQPMEASFVDQDGAVAVTDSTFRFFLPADQPVRIKLQLSPQELKEDVALKIGWANFRSTEDLDVWALIRIVKPDGTLIDKHALLSEKPSHS
jgi:hypothetical protein